MEIALEKEKIADNLTEQDLHMHMSFGFVVRSRLGSLIALRAELQKIFSDNFTYPELSSTPLYVVHWNDLSEDAKQAFELKTKRKKTRR